MSTIAEGLAVAFHSLPKADKVKLTDHLWKDADFREAAVDIITKELLNFWGNKKVEYPSCNGNNGEKGLTSKERGKRLRERYISDLQKNGVRIDQADTVWAKTMSGLWVAIPTATMEWRPGRWFLGLPEAKVSERINEGGAAVVLLCQSAADSRLDFVIPPDIVRDIVPKLSKSKGQLKFNLKRLGNRYQLVIPGDGTLDVTDYAGMASILQS